MTAAKVITICAALANTMKMLRLLEWREWALQSCGISVCLSSERGKTLNNTVWVLYVKKNGIIVLIDHKCVGSSAIAVSRKL